MTDLGPEHPSPPEMANPIPASGEIRGSAEGRRLRAIDWQPRYSTGQGDLVADFYGPVLERCETYDRATGYFRSSFYDLTRRQVAAFVLRGGHIRLVCSPDLEARDLEAIERGADAAAAADDALRRELERVLDHPHASSGSEILAALLATGTLEIKLAFRPGHGIFHDKFGIFGDRAGDRISFAGSINETWNAWHPLGNHESFEVFTSWSDDTRRVEDHAEIFDRLWSSNLEGVTVLDASPEALAVLRERASDDPMSTLSKLARRPLKHRRPLLDHQRAAIAAWQRAGRRGIFKHATGSGKTITALDAIRDHISKGRPALVLVPSTLLLHQWDEEARTELADLGPAILLAGGGTGDWRRLVRPFTAAGGDARMTIAILDTAGSADFLRRVQHGDHLLVVADEVHRLGAPRKAAGLLGIDAGATLGLSATPERAGDPEGTQRILDYFGPVLTPEFTLADAIAAGRLCEYEYHVHLVGLTTDEEERWEALSKRIRQLSARQRDDGSRRGNDLTRLDPQLAMLLILRARIARGAAAKAPVAASVVQEHARPGEHWLIYCDDIKQLDLVRTELARLGITSMPYYSDMRSDRGATLDRFSRDGGVLVSIKCLDEGVDIPAVSHALIVASSRNPREFIQRRGRVLRTHPDKSFAVVHDLIVEPPDPAADDFRSLVLGELARAHEFATHALNPSAALAIKALAIDWDLDPGEFLTSGFEEDADSSDDD